MVFNENVKVAVALKQLLDSAAVGRKSPLHREAYPLGNVSRRLVAANDDQFRTPVSLAILASANTNAKWRIKRHFECETIRSWVIEAAAQSMVAWPLGSIS